MEKNKYYKELLNRILDACWSVNMYAADKDNARNHFNSGMAHAYALVLSDMGHDVDIAEYGDEGFLKVAKIKFDGEVFYDFEK